MNERVTQLLQPVSAEQPCGPDLSNDPRFDELQTLLKGTPEVEIGSIQRPAEPPDWRELGAKSAAFLAASKHLAAATMWCCSALKNDGLPGFRDGLQVLAGLVEQYWPALYPSLDPEDNNDPTQRLNILGALTVPRGSSRGGWMTFVDYLYTTPICQPRGGAAVTFDDLLSTEALDAASPAAAAIRAAPGKQIAGHRETLAEALEAVKKIDQFLTTTLGAGGAISFEVLENTLTAMNQALAPFAGGSDAAAAATPAASETASAASEGETSSSVSVRGPVKSRADVLQQLERICAYYDQVEPSSPVPYLLRRAHALVNMNFLQAIQELNFAPMESLRPVMGTAVDSLGSAQPAAETPPAQS